MEPRKLAIFDFDGTLIKGDSIVSYILFAKAKKAMTLRHFLGIIAHLPLWGFRRMTDAQFKSYALQFLASLSPEKRAALDGAFVKEILLPSIYPKGKAVLDARKKEGYLVLLLSASTENYMQYVANVLEADGLICTKLNEKAEVMLNCKGENKPLLLMEYLKANDVKADFDASCAFGDSKSDLPILELVGNPLIVNGKRKLKKAAPHLPQVNWQ